MGELDNIEFLDRNLSIVDKGKKDRNIKFRLPSFEEISGRWNRFRYKRLIADMEKKKEKLINQNYEANGNHQLTAAGVKNLKKNAVAIAKLEEKILILAKENVPKDYVKRRAIKLKQNMMNNLSFNARSAYIVGANIEKRIFDDEEDINDFQSESKTVGDAFYSEMGMGYDSEDDFRLPDLPKVAEQIEVQPLEKEDEDDVNILPTDSQRQEIRDNISKEFEKVNNMPNNFVSPEEVMEVVNGAYDGIPSEVISNSPSSIENDSQNMVNMDGIGEEDVRTVIEEEMEAMPTQDGTFVDEVSQNFANPNMETIGREAIGEVIGKEIEVVPTQDGTLVDEASQNFANAGIGEIGREAVEEVIGKEMEVMPTQDGTLTDEVSQDFANAGIGEIGRDDVGEVIEEKMNNFVLTQDETFGDETSQNGVDIEVSNVGKEMDIVDDKAPENINVSKNGSTVVRTDRFDENGELKVGLIEQKEEPPYIKFNYTPMTDEEIAQARENIEYDKYEEKYGNYKLNTSIMVPDFNKVFVPISANNSLGSESEKDLPIVVPERDFSNSFEQNNGDQNIHFDYTEATAEDLSNAVEQTTSLGDAALLMKRAMELREKQKETKEQMEEERRKAEELERKQQEVEKAAKAKLERLRVYNEAVEEDCAYNAAAAKQAEEIAAENAAKIKANEELMNEIDSIIGGEAINVSVRGR